MICAHRGDTTHGAKENTLDAVREALSSGADMIEVDVQMTSDGVIVCHHDETITVGPDTLTIWQETYRSLCARLGEKAPAKFEDILTVAHNKAYLNIEMKEYSSRAPETFVTPLVDLVRKQDMGGYCLYSSFRIDYLQRMPWDTVTTVIHPTSDIINFFNARSASPVILPRKVEELLPSELMGLARAVAYACKLDELTEARLNDVHSRNIHLSVYTITHEEEFERALLLGARAVVTDIPHKLVQVRNERYPQ